MKLSHKMWFFIVLEVILLVVFIVLAFLEKDYVTSVEVIIAILAIVLDILACKRDKCWLHIVIICGLIMVDIIWAKGIWLNSAKGQEGTADERFTENTDTVIPQDIKVDMAELDMKEDPLLKSLDKYTNEAGTDKEKMRIVITGNLKNWMKGWNSLALGTVSAGYAATRGRVDEIYTIRCIPEAKSAYLQDDAVNDYDLCINEIKKLYEQYTNPELKKEEAAMYVEKGDLCQRLGRESEADAAYHNALNIAWEGLEESIKYGMSTNTKDMLNILKRSYSGMKVLGTVDEWDRKRADELEKVFEELEKSFDSILKEQTKNIGCINIETAQN